MGGNSKIIVIIAVTLILICLIFAITNKNDNEIIENNGEETEISVDYREMTNEVTGDTYYQVYNEKTGEIIANVAEEHQVDLYIDNPYYVEAEISEDSMGEEMPMEVLEP